MDKNDYKKFIKYFQSYCQQINKLIDEHKHLEQEINSLQVKDNDIDETLKLLNQMDHRIVLMRLAQKWKDDVYNNLNKQQKMVNKIRDTLSKMRAL